MFNSGTIVGNRFKLMSHLGKGACGTVCEALDTITEKSVAIKFVSLSMSLMGNYSLIKQGSSKGS